MEELAINIQNEIRKSVGLDERSKISFDNPATTPQTKSSLPMGEGSKRYNKDITPSKYSPEEADNVVEYIRKYQVDKDRVNGLKKYDTSEIELPDGRVIVLYNE